MMINRVKYYFRAIRFSVLALFFFVSISLSAQRFLGEGGVIHDFNGEFSRDLFPVAVSGLKPVIDSSFGLLNVCLNINHPKVSDLKIQLMSPDGTTIWLTNRNGGDTGEDYQNTCFSPTAFNGYIHEGKAPFIGEYIPDSRMEFINNGQNPNDYWYLVIEDLNSGNTGKLNGFSLLFGPSPVFSAKSPCSPLAAAGCASTPGSPDSSLMPDLVVLPSFTKNQIREYPWNDPVYPGQLRVAASVANIGEGPMEIEGSGRWYCEKKRADSGTRCRNGELARQRIDQHIYYKSGAVLRKKTIAAGTMYFDEKPGHQHYHVDNWIEIRVVKKIKTKQGIKQSVVGKSNKVSYCLFDTGICLDGDSLCALQGSVYGKKQLPNYGLGTYTDCHSHAQGISVGGYDTYGMFYEGQNVKLPRHLKPGWYTLQIIADPKHLYREKNKRNNVYEQQVYLSLQ